MKFLTKSGACRVVPDLNVMSFLRLYQKELALSFKYLLSHVLKLHVALYLRYTDSAN